jgi:hypothetical protein
MAILIAVSEVYEFVTREHNFQCIKSKLNSSRYGFALTKPTATNLVTCLNIANPIACPQGQLDSRCSDLRNASIWFFICLYISLVITALF